MALENIGFFEKGNNFDFGIPPSHDLTKILEKPVKKGIVADVESLMEWKAYIDSLERGRMIVE